MVMDVETATQTCSDCGRVVHFDTIAVSGGWCVPTSAYYTLGISPWQCDECETKADIRYTEKRIRKLKKKLAQAEANLAWLQAGKPPPTVSRGGIKFPEPR